MDTFEVIIIEFSRLIKPLADASDQGIDGIINLCYEAGLNLKSILRDINDLGVIANNISNSYRVLRTIAESRRVEVSQIPDLLNLVRNLACIFDDISNLEVFNNLGDEFKDIGKIIFDFLFLHYIQRYHPAIYDFLIFFGIISEGRKIDQLFAKLDFNYLFEILDNPIIIARDIYKWGTDDFDFNLFLSRLQRILWHFGIDFQNTEDIDIDLNGGLMDKKLKFPIISLERGGEVGITIIPLQSTGTEAAGLAVVPLLFNIISETIQITDQWKLNIQLSSDYTTHYGIIIRPSGITPHVESTSTSPSMHVEGTIKRETPKDEKILLFGNPRSTKFEIGTISLKFGFKIDTEASFTISLPIEGHLVIDSSEGDGFIQKVLPKDPLYINFFLTPGYSTEKGFFVEGSAGFEYTFQINKSLGPIFINTLDLELGINSNEIVLITSVTGGVSIGPVTAVVQKIGLKTIIELGKPGLLGKADLSLGFKPPSMIGFGIDTESVKCWGMLEIDPPNYAGGFGLTLVDKIAVAAYVLISTELPDGKPGFSILMSLMAEFTPGIQLGYGFVLNGIGGLFGFNRRFCEEALREGLQTGETTRIMKTDLSEDSANILTALRAMYPPCEGYYVFGPMVSLFWGGAKKIIEFRGGVFIEIGGPGRVVILGSVHSVLPNKDSPVIELNVDTLGFIDFGKKTLAIDGVIYNSKILNKYSLSGEMVLRVSWGNNPVFVVSLGGFHPRARHIPPDIRKTKRIMVSFGKKNPRISLSSYLAITSNTFQTGSDLDLYYKKKGFTVTSNLGFDALIIFSPFSFEVDIYARAKVKKGGSTLLSIDLKLDLTGPNPYRVKGYGKFEICKVDVKVKFDKTFGDKISESLPTVSPAAMLREELLQSHPLLEIPPWASKGVVLTKDAEKYLDPLGTVIWTQTRVPINIRLDRCGKGKPPPREKKLNLEVHWVKSTGEVDLVEVLDNPPKEFFPPGQWKDMGSDSAKLAAIPFEKWPSGVSYAGPGLNPPLDLWQIRENEYETRLVNPPELSQSQVTFIRVDQVFSIAQQPERIQLTTKSWALRGGRKYFKPRRTRHDTSNPNFIQVKEPKYTVTTHEAEEDVFKRLEINDAVASNMTYHEALDIAKENGEFDVVVRDAAFAASFET